MINMKLMPVILKAGLAIFFLIIISCKKETDNDNDNHNPQTFDTLDITEVQSFLFNIPINNDTILADKDYNIDFRIEIEGHVIDSVFLFIDNNYLIKYDTYIISTSSLQLYTGLHTISFLIRSVKSESGDTVFFKSKSLLFKIVENLSNRYVHPAVDGGKLLLTWEEFDKKNTIKYIVERWLIDDKFNSKPDEKKYYQTYEVGNASFIDNYYVGERAEYKITVLNKEGNKQDIWYYQKPSEEPNYYMSQNVSGGYNLNFSKCKYFNNFGQYYITDGYNSNPNFIHSTNNINDTILNIADAKFGSEARFWLQYLPKQLPDNFLENDWNIYGKFIYVKYGTKSFKYDRIAIINAENVAITSNGKIYKYNINTNQKTDSIIKNNAQYGFLRTTPAGDYLYAADENVYGSPVYIWATNNFKTSPDYTFQIDFIIPPISDNLIAFMAVPSNTTSSKLAIYNAKSGDRIYTTAYEAYGSLRRVSSNGEYFLTDEHQLKLFSYINNTFNSIYIESDWMKSYSFFDFNPMDYGICYVWNSDKVFSIRNTSNFSEIKSFPLELDKIINIDYYSKKIMGYVTDKILIYNLDNGTLEKAIPANLSELFFYSNNTVLIGNSIYSNHGIKYNIE